MSHIDGGAEQVVISVRGKGNVKTFVMGVNEDEYDPGTSCGVKCFLYHKQPGIFCQGYTLSNTIRDNQKSVPFVLINRVSMTHRPFYSRVMWQYHPILGTLLVSLGINDGVGKDCFTILK